ncbi:hypothetical protein [Sphingomonas sanxanigenens]|uniref:Secreted protein n=1 Tax=Sphingomonas sanxanigenens DSM 19645 = NX02 TaxID=1123269 RepID=W0ACV7_9SPHN|nr:hypothetical protein [Sphingomonas sanxanigenens]AHE55739.1 hypothetical protein NX02_20490 [Sphingomonas sanxanigenens DSM 19645 = NX02]
MIRLVGPAAMLAAALSLSACGERGDEAVARNLENQYDDLANQQDAMAANATSERAEDTYAANAAELREQGDDAAESVRNPGHDGGAAEH